MQKNPTVTKAIFTQVGETLISWSSTLWAIHQLEFTAQDFKGPRNNQAFITFFH